MNNVYSVICIEDCSILCKDKACVFNGYLSFKKPLIRAEYYIIIANSINRVIELVKNETDISIAHINKLKCKNIKKNDDEIFFIIDNFNHYVSDYVRSNGLKWKYKEHDDICFNIITDELFEDAEYFSYKNLPLDLNKSTSNDVKFFQIYGKYKDWSNEYMYIVKAKTFEEAKQIINKHDNQSYAKYFMNTYKTIDIGDKNTNIIVSKLTCNF